MRQVCEGCRWPKTCTITTPRCAQLEWDDVVRSPRRGQSRAMSFVEALTNAIVSFFIAWIAGFVIYPLWGITPSAGQNAGITLCFLILGLIRSYVIRRWFTRVH